jgi:hypothetical protein
MTAMDGIVFFESMKDQEEATIKEQRKETTMRQMSAETKIEHGKKEPQRFDMSKDDDVPMETHEAELAEQAKYKKERTQARKDKMKGHLRKKLAKKKATED